MDNRSMVATYGTTFMAGFVAGVALLFVVGIATERDIRYMGVTHDSNATDVLENGDALNGEEFTEGGTVVATLSVFDQMPGATVSVQHIEISEGGWAVVHETEGGHVLNALGAARLDAGVHENVSIELLRETNPGSTYAVILYSDNGNKEFEIRGDLPMIDVEGNPVMQSFRTYGGAAGR